MHELPKNNRRSFQLAVVALLVIVLSAALSRAASSLGERAGEVAAQRTAQRALVAQKAIYSDNGTYGDAAAVNEMEPSLSTTSRTPQIMSEVYVRSDGATTTLASADDDGNCYWIRDDGASTLYAKTRCGDEPPPSEFKPSW